MEKSEKDAGRGEPMAARDIRAQADGAIHEWTEQRIVRERIEQIGSASSRSGSNDLGMRTRRLEFLYDAGDEAVRNGKIEAGGRMMGVRPERQRRRCP